MRPPTPIGAFADASAEARYFATYRAAMAAMPPPVSTEDVPTAFGAVRTYRHGPATGSPIVLLPAFWATAAMWSPNIADLAEDHPVYTLDTLGQPGASVQTAPIRTAADCAAWLDDVVTALGLHDVHLVGCSYGGWLAFNQAVHSPERLATVTLIEPANVLARRSARFRCSVVALLPVVPRGLTRRVMAWALGNPTVYEPMHSIAELIAAGAHDYRALGTSPAPGYPSDDELRSVQTPTLTLLGGRSVVQDYAAAADRARDLLAAGEVELWASASHAVSAQVPAEVNRRILNFVRAHPHSPTAS